MYAKVFSQIYDSSIAENYLTRLVFTDLLTLADINGVVDMTREAIARRTNVPLDMVCAAIAELEAPDPKSRTPDEDGRRIARLDQHRDWGWLIVNYQRFREIASEEQRRAKTLERVRKHRGKEPVTQCNAPETLVNACNAMQREREREREGGRKPPRSVAHLSILDIKDVITFKKSQAQEIKHRFSSEVAMGTHWSDDEKRKEHRSLRAEIKKLEGEIAQRA